MCKSPRSEFWAGVFVYTAIILIGLFMGWALTPTLPAVP